MRMMKVAGQVAIGLAVLELCLRLYNPLPFRVRGERIVLPVRQVYTFDNRGASKLDPVTRHTKNALGFRGPDPPRDFASRLTIVTIGGSTTECLFLSDGKTWTDELARRLAPAFPRAWVNNGGLDGQSTYGHLVLLHDFVVGLHPRVAIFLIGANDVGLGRSNTYDSALNPAGTSLLHRASSFIVDHSQVAFVAQNLVRAGRARQRGFGHSQIDLREARQLAMDDGAVRDTLAQHRTTYLEPFRARVAALVALCRANGIEPVLATQPALFGDATDPATGVSLAAVQVNGRGNGHLEWQLLEMYNDVTRAIGAREHVPIVDLARELPKDSRLFYDFLHFTNEGAARVGQIVAADLEPWLRERFPPDARGTAD